MTTVLPPPPPASKTTKPPDASKPSGLAFERIEPGVANTRLIVNAVEGWGKTTLMAYSPKPVIVRSPQESGFVTLRKADRVPDVPTIAAEDWPGLLAIVGSDSLTEYGTVCFDVLGGLEELCRLHVLRTAFGGQDEKYGAYGKGNAMMANEWMKFLAALETLSERVSIIIASHARVARAKDPMLDDYDRYVADCHEKVWAPTKRWADAVLFGTFYSFVDEGKGKGGTDRVVYTEHRATHDAKNRWGMPPMVKIPASPEKVYDAVFASIPH